MNKNIIIVRLYQLIPASWNYKKDDEEKAQKLKKSILEDNSAGVPAVRELDKTEDGKQLYEVIDGNHRLQALKELAKENKKWGKVVVENFGRINKAKAILIARRRNYLWFEDDVIKFAEIFTKDVLPEIDIQDMAEYMPESIEDLEGYAKLLDFDWDQFEKSGEEVSEEGEEWIVITVRAPKQEVDIFYAELERMKEIGDTDSDWVALKYMAVNSANTPAESLQ